MGLFPNFLKALSEITVTILPESTMVLKGTFSIFKVIVMVGTGSNLMGLSSHWVLSVCLPGHSELPFLWLVLKQSKQLPHWGFLGHALVGW